MIERTVAYLNRYFDDRIAACKRRQMELLADDRSDEARFEKISANVYGIFQTILALAVELYRDDEKAARRFFVQRLEEIPSDWAEAYELARQHDNLIRQLIEKTKLDAVDEIKEYFAIVWEETE